MMQPFAEVTVRCSAAAVPRRTRRTTHASVHDRLALVRKGMGKGEGKRGLAQLDDGSKRNGRDRVSLGSLRTQCGMTVGGDGDVEPAVQLPQINYCRDDRGKDDLGQNVRQHRAREVPAVREKRVDVILVHQRRLAGLGRLQVLWIKVLRFRGVVPCLL